MTSLRPLTLTNSITRKSSAAVSISSTSMMMFGCFTRRSIDTSFSIRCSCQMKSLERWIRNHRTLCSALHFGGQQCRSDAGRSNSLGRDGPNPSLAGGHRDRTSQRDISLSLPERNRRPSEHPWSGVALARVPSPTSNTIRGFGMQLCAL